MTQLLSGERILAQVRQSWFVLVPTVVTGVVAVAVVLLILHFVPSSIGGHSSQTVKNWITLAALVVASLAILKDALQWRAEAYVLTSHRIVLTRGIVSRATESISLDRIQDTVVRRNIAARMIGCGDVEIESAGRDGAELLRLIPNPDALYAQLMQAMEEYRHPAGGSSPLPPGMPSPSDDGL